jgi:hypothetical protein
MAMAEVGQSCATARHANLVQIGCNETRALSFMSAPRINSGTRAAGAAATVQLTAKYRSRTIVRPCSSIMPFTFPLCSLKGG